jgi:hypothetical protein
LRDQCQCDGIRIDDTERHLRIEKEFWVGSYETTAMLIASLILSVAIATGTLSAPPDLDLESLYDRSEDKLFLRQTQCQSCSTLDSVLVNGVSLLALFQIMPKFTIR